MNIADFDYHLPSGLIAQTPIEPRDHSRLMVLSRNDGTIEHRCFRDITSFLTPGDIIVFNDSRVIPARFMGYKASTGGRVEVFLLHQIDGSVWETLVRPAKRVKAGTIIEITGDGKPETSQCLEGEVIGEGEGGIRTIRFSDATLLMKLGNIPLPPYIHSSLEDPQRYQTVYARVNGSVAAPTAGLHFTPELLDDIKAKGIEFSFVTLHVGLGTFQPVREEDPRRHRMHQEYCELNPGVASRLSRAKEEGRRIISVGTSTARVLEQAASGGGDGQLLRPFKGWTELFILPGYQFRIVDVLLTNFHLPRSTLLMLVTAFARNDLIRRAYHEAIKQRYRFYSFGDAMLII